MLIKYEFSKQHFNFQIQISALFSLVEAQTYIFNFCIG